MRVAMELPVRSHINDEVKGGTVLGSIESACSSAARTFQRRACSNGFSMSDHPSPARRIR